MPGEMPSNFMQYLFWCSVVTVGSLFKRLARPYRKPPLCFATLVDPSIASVEAKRKLASFLLNMPQCCLDRAFTQPLHEVVSLDDDLLLQNRVGFQILTSAFCSKNHNIELENNFARANSWNRTNRGRTDRSYNLISKHILAEAQHIHRRSQLRQNQSTWAIPSNVPALDDASDRTEGLDCFSNFTFFNSILCFYLINI